MKLSDAIQLLTDCKNELGDVLLAISVPGEFTTTLTSVCAYMVDDEGIRRTLKLEKTGEDIVALVGWKDKQHPIK